MSKFLFFLLVVLHDDLLVNPSTIYQWKTRDQCRNRRRLENCRDFSRRNSTEKKTTKPMNLTFIAIELSHIGIFEKEASIFFFGERFQIFACVFLSFEQPTSLDSLVDRYSIIHSFLFFSFS